MFHVAVRLGGGSCLFLRLPTPSATLGGAAATVATRRVLPLRTVAAPVYGRRGMATDAAADKPSPPPPPSASSSSSPAAGRTPPATTDPRTYKTALRLLDLLPTNAASTSLFANDGSAAEPPSVEKRRQLNERSLPEMREWLARAGYTPEGLAEAGLRCVHIAGTKGKGSVAAYVTAVLVHSEAARRVVTGPVGTYMSPHVVTVRERIMLDGQPISRELFTKYFFELWDRLAASLPSSSSSSSYIPASVSLSSSYTLAAGEASWLRLAEQQAKEMPFFFRFMTLLAFHVFVREGVRSAVIECGIGGEYDATNILPPEAVSVSVITSIEIDHANMLGDTLEEIAWHKCGILKRAVPVIAALPWDEGQDRDAIFQVVRARAIERGATRVPSSWYRPSMKSWLRKMTTVGELTAQRRANMAQASAAATLHLEVLASNGRGFFKPGRGREQLARVPHDFVWLMQDVHLPARHTILEARPDLTLYLDGAHTPESVSQAATWFYHETRSRIANDQGFGSIGVVLAAPSGGGGSGGGRDYQGMASSVVRVLHQPRRDEMQVLRRGGRQFWLDCAAFARTEPEPPTAAEQEELEKQRGGGEATGGEEGRETAGPGGPRALRDVSTQEGMRKAAMRAQEKMIEYRFISWENYGGWQPLSLASCVHDNMAEAVDAVDKYLAANIVTEETKGKGEHRHILITGSFYACRPFLTKGEEDL